MIKIGDTVINKVQKSENDIITELPIVKKSDNTLLHLGYNTYKTTFDNPDLIAADNPFWVLRNFKAGPKVTELSNAMPSTYIKAWLYSTDEAITAAEKTLTLRLYFGAPWEYNAGQYATDLNIDLTYRRWCTSDKVYIKRTVHVYTQNGLTKTEVIEPYNPPDKSLSNAYGCLIAIMIPNDTFIPQYYAKLLSSSTLAAGGIGGAFSGTLPVKLSNVEGMYAGVQIKTSNFGENPDTIKSYIEIGSYKPANFSDYNSNYCLHTGNTGEKRKVGASQEGELTADPFFTASSSNSDNPGSSSGGTTGCVSAASKILVDLEGTTKNAEELHKGDKIVAYNKANGTFIESTIETVYIQRKPIALYALTFEDNTELSITAYHKILTDNGLVSVLDDNDVEQLAVGSKVISKDGEKTIKSVTSRTTEDGEIMYNFRTAEGDMFIANDIIIENESKNTVSVMNLGDNTEIKM